MRRTHKIVLWVILTMGLVILMTSAFAQGGSFTLSWFTIDGGGGTSTSQDGIYALNGTTGQADTQLMTGGVYQLSGGFWNASPQSIPPPVEGDHQNFLPIIFQILPAEIQ